MSHENDRSIVRFDNGGKGCPREFRPEISGLVAVLTVPREIPANESKSQRLKSGLLTLEACTTVTQPMGRNNHGLRRRAHRAAPAAAVPAS
jgi:hypothetical protein